MSGETLPNGFDRATWLSDLEARIADLEAELDATEDNSRRLAISNEITDRRYQLDRRRRYLSEVEEGSS